MPVSASEDERAGGRDLVEVLLEELRSPLVLVDESLMIVDANDSATLILGERKDRLLAKRLGEAFSPELERRLRDRIDELRAKGEISLAGIELDDRFGRRREFAVRVCHLRSAGRNRARYLVVGAERGAPSEAPPAEIDAMRSIERIIRDFPESILLIDNDSHAICGCNASAQARLGYSRDELIGLAPRLLVVDEERAHALLRSDEGGRQGACQGKVLCRRKDGSSFAMIGTFLGLFDRSDRLKYTLAVGRDISDEERGYRELLALTERSKACIDEMEVRLRHFVAPKPATHLSDLGFSPKQVKIAALLCDGEPNKRIAALLEASDSTIKSHIHAMYVKLGVSSKIEFVNCLRSRNISIE